MPPDGIPKGVDKVKQEVCCRACCRGRTAGITGNAVISRRFLSLYPLWQRKQQGNERKYEK